MRAVDLSNPVLKLVSLLGENPCLGRRDDLGEIQEQPSKAGRRAGPVSVLTLVAWPWSWGLAASKCEVLHLPESSLEV